MNKKIKIKIIVKNGLEATSSQRTHYIKMSADVQTPERCHIAVPRVQRYFMSWHNQTDIGPYVQQLTNNNASQNPFIANLIHRFTRPGRVVVAQLMAPLVPVISKRVIGEQGYWLKYTTECTEASFIWHDRELQRFIVVANNASIARRALDAIRYRIYKQIALMQEHLSGDERQILLWQKVAAWEHVNTENAEEMDKAKFAIQHLLAYQAKQVATDHEQENVWFLVDGTLVTV